MRFIFLLLNSIGLLLYSPIDRNCIEKPIEIIKPDYAIAGNPMVSLHSANVGKVEFHKRSNTLIITQRETAGIIQYNLSDSKIKLIKTPFSTSDVSVLKTYDRGIMIYSPSDMVIRCYSDNWNLISKIQTRSSGVVDLYPLKTNEQILLRGTTADLKKNKYYLSELITVSKDSLSYEYRLEYPSLLVSNTYVYSISEDKNYVYAVERTGNSIFSEKSFLKFHLSKPYPFSAENFLLESGNFDKVKYVESANRHDSERILELLYLGNDKFIIVTFLKSSNLSYVYLVTHNQTEKLFSLEHKVRFARLSIDKSKLMMVAYNDGKKFGEMLIFNQNL